jgi:hypothetical protein
MQGFVEIPRFCLVWTCRNERNGVQYRFRHGANLYQCRALIFAKEYVHKNT